MVYQERFTSRYSIPPLQVVGWEGIFGFISLSLLLIPVSEKKNYPGRSFWPSERRLIRPETGP